MMHAIFILDSSGTPVYVWKHENAPTTIFRGKDEILVGSLISALLNFGQETFAAPQRIDFNGQALTFFSGKINDRLYWVVAVSDSFDHRRVTTRILKKLISGLASELSNISIEEGIVFETEKSKNAIANIIDNTVREHIRALPNIRSTPWRSALITTIITTIIMFSYYMILAIPEIQRLFNSILGETYTGLTIVTTATVLAGLIAGIIGCKTISGFISGYVSSLVGYVLATNIPNITTILALAVSFSLVSGIIGAVVGYYFDTIKLNLIKPISLSDLEILDGDESIEITDSDIENLTL